MRISGFARRTPQERIHLWDHPPPVGSKVCSMEKENNNKISDGIERNSNKIKCNGLTAAGFAGASANRDADAVLE